jgi:NTP pyrophosphatase (non-canonical NTP hydrolase)
MSYRISEKLQEVCIDWVRKVDPDGEVTVENTVIKLIEECVEFLRAEGPLEKRKEMADILICAVQAASMLTTEGAMEGYLEGCIDKMNNREYYVKNGKIMRLKDGRDH